MWRSYIVHSNIWECEFRFQTSSWNRSEFGRHSPCSKITGGVIWHMMNHGTASMGPRSTLEGTVKLTLRLAATWCWISVELWTDLIHQPVSLAWVSYPRTAWNQPWSKIWQALSLEIWILLRTRLGSKIIASCFRKCSNSTRLHSHLGCRIVLILR